MTALVPSSAVSGRRRPPHLVWLGRLGLVLALPALVACSDDTGGPQFATDRQPTGLAATPTALAPPPTLPPTVPSAPPRPFAEVVVPRGAPGRIYFRAGPELWTVAADGSKPARVFAPGPGDRLVAASPSPSGDRVAVLVADGSGVGTVLVLDPAGQRLRQYRGLVPPAVSAVATPVASPVAATPVVSSAPTAVAGTPPGTAASTAGATPLAAASAVEPGPRSLDWSPQGDRLLVGFAPGGLIALPIDGDGGSAVIFGRDEASLPTAAGWSPTGEQVAYLTGHATGGGQRLMIGEVGGPPPRPLVTEPMGRTIFAFAWLADGRSLLFTEGEGTLLHQTNTDLWRIDTDGQNRRLVATAGSAAPVADVATIAPSPDGRAVAYTVVVPGEDRPRFHSLWVRDLDAGQSFLVAVPAGVSVTNVWWTSEGLIFEAVAADAAADPTSFELYAVDRAATPRLILRATVAAGTPAPAASPVAGGRSA